MASHLRRKPAPTPRTRRQRSGPPALHIRWRAGGSTEAEAPRAGADELRARNAGGPQDQALYGCSCGCSFAADVSASVPCPRCGELQAW
jgi:hypothetical protein